MTGPVPADPAGTPGRNYPFLITDVDLKGRGYTAEEFFFSGTANSYDLPLPSVANDPPLPTADKVVSEQPYRTRLTVYRPTDPARFNGTVFVEWTNTTANYEIPIWWQRNHEFLLREGYGYVAIAANHAAVHAEPNGLKNWSPQRYGSLNIPLVRQTTEPDDPWGHDDQLSYDIFAQGVKAVRAVPKVLGGLPVRRVIAGGHSRSAVHLGVYVNAVHPRAPIADGVMLLIAGRQVRTDLDIPVMKVLSETDYGGAYDEGTQISARQPDTDRFRTWWISGTTHGDHQSALSGAATYVRDFPNNPLPETDCNPPSLSRIPSHHVVSAAMDAIVKWIREGAAPAHSPLPEFTTATPPALVRDEHGNALGGIRVASFAVPIATDQGTTSCGNFLVGVHVPFDTATLQSQYPSHNSYVHAIKEVARRNVRDGFLLKTDAAELIADAESSLVGTGLIYGPRCANVSTFLNNPSTSILRDHTQTYYFSGGKQLLALLDQATRLVAEGYTAAQRSDDAARKRKFEKAIQSVRRYRDGVQKLRRQGRADQAIADLLVRYADILIERISAETKPA
ncbi:alpha/beta hydrolase domain-containing protein [Streptomyces mirabilis]|uniref:alpha/beta hydrolase domain-containing protein n=1 Tax=Streptomyces mirabilis TaxID=68239 RepID=UPI0033273A19